MVSLRHVPFHILKNPLRKCIFPLDTFIGIDIFVFLSLGEVTFDFVSKALL